MKRLRMFLDAFTEGTFCLQRKKLLICGSRGSLYWSNMLLCWIEMWMAKLQKLRITKHEICLNAFFDWVLIILLILMILGVLWRIFKFIWSLQKITNTRTIKNPSEDSFVTILLFSTPSKILWFSPILCKINLKQMSSWTKENLNTFLFVQCLNLGS